MRFTSIAVLGAAAVLSACQQPSTPAAEEAATPAAAPAAIAAAPVATTAPAGPGVRLEPQPGLWRTTLEGANAPLPDTCAKPEDIEAIRQAQATASGGRTCNQDNAFRREGDAWVARTTCDLHAGGRSETVMTVTGDMSSRYRVQIVTTHKDVPYDSLPDSRMAYSVERVGDC